MAKASGLDWDKLRTEYITGNLSYRDLADKYNVSLQAVRLHASPGGWYKERTEYRRKVARDAIKAASRKDSKILSTLLSSIDRMVKQIDRAMDDPEQMRLHVLRTDDGGETEEVLRKLNWQDARLMAATAKDLLTVSRDLLGIKSLAQIDADDLAAERLELERQKLTAGAEVDEEGTGVVYLPPVADAAPPPEEAGEAAEDGKDS